MRVVFTSMAQTNRANRRLENPLPSPLVNHRTGRTFPSPARYQVLVAGAYRYMLLEQVMTVVRQRATRSLLENEHEFSAAIARLTSEFLV